MKRPQFYIKPKKNGLFDVTVIYEDDTREVVRNLTEERKDNFVRRLQEDWDCERLEQAI